MGKTKNAFEGEGSLPLPHWKTRLYRIWGAMRQRCKNPNEAGYENYGGRGIRVCPEWEDFFAFRAWALTHGYQEDLSIERIDVNGNYCPENCTWATRLQQANNKTNNRFIEFNGKRMTSRQWDRELGFREGVLSDRLNTLGWDLKRTMTEPVSSSRAASFSYKGETHTVSEWAQILGISLSSMWKRLKDPKWSSDDVFERPKHGKTNPLTFQGKTLPLWKWAIEVGIPRDTLWKRIKHSHWTVEKALTTPVRHYNHS